MTGQTWGRDIEMEMTNVVRGAVKYAGSVEKLSRKLQLDCDIIEDIRTGRAYPMTPRTFEDRFKQPLKSLSTPVTADNSNNVCKSKKNEEKIVPVEIRCPGYEELVRLIEKTGRKVKIVYA